MITTVDRESAVRQYGRLFYF